MFSQHLRLVISMHHHHLDRCNGGPRCISASTNFPLQELQPNFSKSVPTTPTAITHPEEEPPAVTRHGPFGGALQPACIPTTAFFWRSKRLLVETEEEIALLGYHACNVTQLLVPFLIQMDGGGVRKVASNNKLNDGQPRNPN